MGILHFYHTPGISKNKQTLQLKKLQKISSLITDLETELCFNVDVSNLLSSEETKILKWLLTSPFNQEYLYKAPNLEVSSEGGFVIEIGPRLNFSTPFSSNVLSICKAVGLTKILRLEVSIRYLITLRSNGIGSFEKKQIINVLHDRMTQCVYPEPIKSFDHGITPQCWSVIDVMSQGKCALKEINDKLGLAFDDWDLDYYTKLFSETLKRNPTSVECFDLAQSNSEHSRHWFFKGKVTLNKEEKSESLLDMIIKTQTFSNSNNVIKFGDNSSAIKGYMINKLCPLKVDEPSNFKIKRCMLHIAFTAETHNFPTGVAPFSGATTGTGGRIRDIQAVGRGGHCIAGTAGYSVGNLLIPGYNLPWEDHAFHYPKNFASPLNILIDASNGASDYGNKFGEPVICGFTRSFGMNDSAGQRREWIKPIMFSGGIGAVESTFVQKLKPEKGMKVVKIGGPVYRIGVGGGSASSIQVQGDNQSELDFNAVQRGDPEMENKLNRLIRACIEDSENNHICSIHDQGAGGNGNVLKELVEPEGAVIFANAFTLGDSSVSTLELWGAEYQESNAILVEEKSLLKLKMIGHRERCPIDCVGVVTGNGKVILSEDHEINEDKFLNGSYENDICSYPFNMALDHVLGDMPRKEFHLNITITCPKELKIPDGITVLEALERVMRLVTVSSKRFLVNKVDRCVTGLIAQQQCVGPLHTPVADCGVTALSMFSKEGVASAIGEQPIKGLICVSAGARMTVAESLTNLMFTRISCLEDVKCSGNWMWAAKLPGEGALLYQACEAMCQFMSELGIAIDGGKDSLSMAARVDGATVKAPGTLVVSTYAPCPDISCIITPDMKSPGFGETGGLLWIKLSKDNRLGGSALAQCFSQLGNNVPDIDNPIILKTAFTITQELISERKILSGHDISDGGLITCVLEMAFAGLSGLRLTFDTDIPPLELLFSEEVGWVVEVALNDVTYVLNKYKTKGILCTFIGESVGYGINSLISVRNKSNQILLDSSLISLFSLWEETSFKLECRQADVMCVTQEFNLLKQRKGPSYKLTFNPDIIPASQVQLSNAPRVAVIREEGINGDREMVACLHMAGFEVWDVVMQDFLDFKVTTDYFCGIIFPGGFSYADVLGSAKGWASCLLFNEKIRNQFETFAMRNDTFSLGVCNGCQLMCLIGWVGSQNNCITLSPDVVLEHNLSERFECRFSTVLIEKSPSIMLKGMEGSVLGIWIAHGEGRFTYRNENVRQNIENSNCFPLKYTDDDGIPTEVYPLNPNGSQGGVAGICSYDGRHLAVMPHPERCALMWQWPYIPPSMRHLSVSPWMRMFQNAFAWAQKNSL